MSLLMDALKKAEQDKKKAADRLGRIEADEHKEEEKAGSTSAGSMDSEEIADSDNAGKSHSFRNTVSLSLQPIEESAIESPVSGSEIATDTDEAGSLDSGKDEIQARDEDITDEHAALPYRHGIITPGIDTSRARAIQGLSTAVPAAPFDDTFHGVIFNDKEEQAEAFKETLPGIPAADLIRDIGGGENQPTPVAAQTVFSASVLPRSGQAFKWTAYLMLVVIAVLAYATLNYFTNTPVSRDIPSPMVARGIETTIVPAPEPVSAQVIDPGAVAVPPVPVDEQSLAEATVSAGETETATPTETAAPEASTWKPEQPAVAAAMLTEPEDAKVVIQDEPEVTEPEQPAADMDTPEQGPVIAAVEPPSEETLPDRITIEPELVHISKTVAPEQNSSTITRAYAAYTAGRYADAEAAYREVLADMPDNRDALLGLAAIALQNGRQEAAFTHYLQLLDINPEDRVAMAALVNLSGKTDPHKSESVIKSLLGQGPDDAYLYFTLGNIYASQSRWPEAQQSFFNAYRQESGNPDYALNLAVSLDHIGQYKTALDYYNVALGLADMTTPGFDAASVTARIQALTNVVNPGL